MTDKTKHTAWYQGSVGILAEAQGIGKMFNRLKTGD